MRGILICVAALLVWTGALAGQAVSPARGERFEGRVIRIHDGDSLVVRRGSRSVEVRLADVDAPERGQPYADRARRQLESLLENRDVRLDILDIDSYQRRVARVHRLQDGLDVNAELVSRGSAWVYRRYLRDPGLIDLEQAARAQRRGLWSLPESQRIPPWRYRALERRRLPD